MRKYIENIVSIVNNGFIENQINFYKRFRYTFISFAKENFKEIINAIIVLFGIFTYATIDEHIKYNIADRERRIKVIEMLTQDLISSLNLTYATLDIKIKYATSSNNTQESLMYKQIMFDLYKESIKSRQSESVLLAIDSEFKNEIQTNKEIAERLNELQLSIDKIERPASNDLEIYSSNSSMLGRDMNKINNEIREIAKKLYEFI